MMVAERGAPRDTPGMTFRFRVAQAFRWVDVDSFGVVNNAVYLSLFEHARYEYCKALAILAEGDISFVLGETTVRYLRPGRLGMAITVAARTTRLGSKSFDMRYEVATPDERLVEGSATLVWVDRTLRTVAIPAPARAAIARYEGIEPGPAARG
jgi:acyl-CoA thioester hydrolase